MLALLDRAYVEGETATKVAYEERLCKISAEHKAEMEVAKETAYRQGVSDTLSSVNIKPSTEEQLEMPTHNITNPIVREYFANLPEGGYSQTDVSRMRYYTKFVKESSTKNMADRGNPYLVFCAGDSLLLECDGEKPQTILPENNVFACYLLMPEKIYHWKVYKDGKVIKEGSFRTIGDVRLINIPTWPNMRDIAYTPLMKAGLVYSGANPDSVVVDSADHEIIRYLDIDTQINLRTPKAGSSMDKAWRPDIFTYGYDIDIAAYSSIFTSTAKFKKAFETLVSELEKGRKVAFNCWAGADRTGTFRYVLQGLCDVPKHTAQGYYELTSLMYWLNTKMWDKEEDSGGELRTLDKNLEKRFGKDFYTQCYRLMTEVIKVSPETIKKFQDIMKK